MKIATWNVNSIRTRQERVLAWLEEYAPDVLCLQETKVEDDKFPTAEFERIGYQLATFGQRSYNGVAIVARDRIADVARGLGDGVDDEQARLIAGTVAGVRVVSVYVPNGKAVGHERYQYKLDWLRRLRAYLDRNHRLDNPLIVLGDFNVAPDDRDVYDPLAWNGAILCSDLERSALQHVLGFGLVDAFRELHPEPGFYTWWDYRMLGFVKNRGLRIDLALVTAPIRERLTEARIDRNARKGKKPSDHAPVVIELA
jgi:exodeoxyribonuclease III